MTARCPPDDALLALAAGQRGAAADATRDHAASCARCAAALRGFEQAREALVPEAPGPFQTARMARELERAIDGDVRAQRSAWRGPRVAAAVAVAAMSGAALATVATGGLSSQPSLPPPAPAPAVRPAAATPEPEPPAAAPLDEPGPEALPEAAEPDPEPAPEAPPPAATRRRAPSPLERAERALADLPADASPEELLAVGGQLEDAGAADRATELYVRALAHAGQGAASLRLTRLVRRGSVSPEDIVARLRATSEVEESAEGMRLRCEWGLKYRGDRRAVDDCRAFGRAWPTHPAVRVLALAAGKAAESRLEDLELAVEEYSRALLVSEYAGVSGTHALLARARAPSSASATKRRPICASTSTSRPSRGTARKFSGLQRSSASSASPESGGLCINLGGCGGRRDLLPAAALHFRAVTILNPQKCSGGRAPAGPAGGTWAEVRTS